MDIAQQKIAILSEQTFINLSDALKGLNDILSHAEEMGTGELPVSRDDICKKCGISTSTFDHYRGQVRANGNPVIRSYKLGKNVLVYPSEFREDLQMGVHPGVCVKS